MQGFSQIPILDLDQIYSPTSSAYHLFLSSLQDALVHVGFFYLKNHGIPQTVQDAALERSRAFFDLPLEKKLEIETVKSRHFVGYNRMRAEKTVSLTDHNESIAVCSPLLCLRME
jgi:isopenicillin N synthase-like dioxygenase